MLLNAGEPVEVLACGVEGDAVFSVHGMKGELLLSVEIPAGQEELDVDTGKLSKGTYIYSIRSATQKFFGQFMIK